MTARDHDDYLWNPDAPPDRDVARLEALLSPLRYDAPLRPTQTVPGAAPGSVFRTSVPLAAAASLAILVGAAALAGKGSTTAAVCEAAGADEPWAVVPELGAPRCDGSPIRSVVRLAEGRSVVTGDDASATIRVADIGTITVAPGSQVRLLSTHDSEHRLELQRGAIHAQIDAPPRLFVVETAWATAYDLGCEYTLAVDDRGNGMLHVTFGYVSFERDGIESWVPAGARCETRAGIGPGTPFYEGTSQQLREALSAYDFEGDTGAIDRVLALARPNDALTLWHLLPRVDARRRPAVFGRLAELAPPPDEVRERDVVRGDEDAMKAWRADIEAVGFNPE